MRKATSPVSTVARIERPAPAATLGGPDLAQATRLGHRFDEIPTHPSPGHPLPGSVRGHFERMFGADFSDVRVHRESTLSPSPLHAFTRGAHLHFAPTRYRPGTPKGDALIGHELAHVTQQREGRVEHGGGELGLWNTSPHLEREAHALGERAAQGEAVPVSTAAARPRVSTSPPAAQAGPFDMLGHWNPRLFAPTWLGGHSEDHLEARKWDSGQRRSGPLDLLGPANPRQYLPTSLGGHSYDELSRRQRNGTDDWLTALPRSLAGHAVRGLGKATGSQSISNAGKRMHYGHLSPEQLLKQHPKAFLRQHPIESGVEGDGGQVENLRSSTRQQFYLSRYEGRRPGYTLHRPDDPPQFQRSRETRGPLFHAAFLPMRQMAQDTDAPGQVEPRGEVRDSALDRAKQDVTLTAQLSGCSITHQGGCLRHLRPETSGVALQNNLDILNPGGHSYGARDYPGQTSFVMTKKKRNGGTRLYYQRHANPGLSGRRDL
ncbi:MAG TPA: DUF4157 domain-containing protein [Thermoanaerobaculia bacterium]|nr:DUF4157 domain-containing protein [Thermoanaerobaculia bacterium]